MTGALVSLAIFGAFAGASAVLLALRNAGLREQKAKIVADNQALDGALKDVLAEMNRLERSRNDIVGRYELEIEELYAELEICQDPAVRSRAAMDGIKRLLELPEDHSD